VRTVLVTGVTGFLGFHLATHLATRGFHVVGSTSRDAGLRVATPGVERKVVLRLEGALDPGVVRGVDAVIHGAWDLRPGTLRANVEGTARLVEAARAAGVTHQVFMSTCSAHPAAVSEYGRGKLLAQQHVLRRGQAAVRLGLVIGPGGLFQRLSDTVAHHRLVPLLDGGRGAMPVLALADFLQALGEIVERQLTGLFTLFNPDPVMLRDVVLAIARAAQRRSLLVPVPSSLLVGPLWLLGRVGITLPVSVDNVRGWRANLNVRDRSDLPAFVARALPLAEMVRAAREAASGTGANWRGRPEGLVT